MITDEDIHEAIEGIDRIWRNPGNRNEVFGNILRLVGVNGIRGLDTTIEFGWPVIAVAGVNGAG